jgi:hypothetical protein
LFQSHLSDCSQCACGDAIENNVHYFYVCPLFIKHRIQLFNSLRKFQDFLNLDILLKGSPQRFGATCIYGKTFQCYIIKYKEKENLLNHVNFLLPVMKWWTASNISVFSSTVRIGEPFNNIYSCKSFNYSGLNPTCTCLSQSQELFCLDISPLIYLFVYYQ